LNNPVFWLFMALLFLILLKIWVAKKAFIFTVLIAIILLLTTLAEERFIHLLSPTNESLNLWLVRFMAVVIVACLSFLFLFFG
jgi:cation transport ATPase